MRFFWNQLVIDDEVYDGIYMCVFVCVYMDVYLNEWFHMIQIDIVYFK